MTTGLNTSNTSPEELNKLLSKARISLMLKQDFIFFATVLLSMKFVWDDTHRTAWTNGLKIGFNRNFFLSLTPDERIFVLVHECCHVAYMHTLRLGTRDRKEFNIAADHVINLMLIARGFTMPAIGLADKQYRDLSTEQVYDILMQRKAQNQPTPDNGLEDLRSPGEDEGEGSTSDGDGDTPSQGHEMSEADAKAAIDDILVRAALQCKMTGAPPGSIPSEIELYLAKLLNPKLPWQQILRKWLSTMTKSGYTFKKPNRRFFPEHYLPSMWGEGKLTDFQAWVDISGSETDDDFLRFISEINGIMRMMKPKKIELGQFDTCIKSITPVRNIMDLAKVKFHGRGGTLITEVLDHIEKTKPRLAMIFSDGGFYHDRETCNANILWMIHDNPNWTAPFGRVIHYNTHS